MISKYLNLPRGLRIDIYNVPEDLEAQVQKTFGEYTEGTSSDYTDEDRLCFIDVMMKNIRQADPYDKVNEMIKDRFSWELEEQGRIMDSDEFYDGTDFFAECYEAGQKAAQLRYKCDDHHINDIVNPIIVRVIRAVMDWSPEV